MIFGRITTFLMHFLNNAVKKINSFFLSERIGCVEERAENNRFRNYIAVLSSYNLV
jgi:hypothetical protein